MTTTNGDLDRLAKALITDAVLVQDGGNLGALAPDPIRGTRSISKTIRQEFLSLIRVRQVTR